jgi:ankyrin repeat protein
MMAVLGGSRTSTDVVGVLLEHGADINLKDVDGKTAIQLAEEELEDERRRAAIIRLLKETNP